MHLGGGGRENHPHSKKMQKRLIEGLELLKTHSGIYVKTRIHKLL